MATDNRREQLFDIIKREFIGPDPLDIPELRQENGEEILFSDPPHIRYVAGILFPQGALPSVADAVKEEDETVRDEPEQNKEVPLEGIDEKASGHSELLQETEEVLNLSNAYRQSAISLTTAIRPNQKIVADISAGTYERIAFTDSKSGKRYQRYARRSLRWNNDNNLIELPDRNQKQEEYKIFENNKETHLSFLITYRYLDSKNGKLIYTFTLRNNKQLSSDEAIRDEDCFFQVSFSLKSDEGFSCLPDSQKININDEDYQSNLLLYRDVKNYAIGHGCSADWVEHDGRVTEIHTEIFPSYEIKPIIPATIPGVSLEMYKMSDLGDFNTALRELEELCDRYRTWIDELKKGLKFDIRYHKTAERHIKDCEACHQRMCDGVQLLKNNLNVRKAFQYMNRAMLLQQLHYNLPLQMWEDNGHGELQLIKQYSQIPDIDDKTTWYGDISRYGKWRPFQLAFILINLKSMADRECEERNHVDLIWFPTGGGKTEAYLGLSAYTIFIRKLMNRNDSGTAIIMRYTLRLLTAQQYERASSMICACELIRKEKEAELGSSRITIGLWVGGDNTPNKMADAVTAYQSLKRGGKEDNPFIMLKCPWCGAQMGVVPTKNKNIRHLPGYRKIVAHGKEIIFQCKNDYCSFSRDDFNLPLLVVDEAIYNSPPTLLLGTVDKFAMLPFLPESQKLFGIYPEGRKGAPDLIIQDELHLISGPLGSMVGHYETMIHELCTIRENEKEYTPKVIASTATISRAKEQCNALYNCGTDRVDQFPPSGLNAGDSFFAVEDKNGVGRRYIGVLAAGSSSYATTTIRLYATLLYAAKALCTDTEEARDPYWTNVGYFNSLRELGQAATWISADIDEYLHTIYKRRYEDKVEGYKDNRRYIYRYEELTSRIRGNRIPMSLQNLGIRYPGKERGKRPVDVCLATNMISVGVDVPRLGLMTVTGQPKTTAEYIQATSRVGRSLDSPGIVFTTYHPGKPRDKSHYEHFRSYHSRIYCHVEPTSVTPFSSPLRKRALHAVLIGLVRLLGNCNQHNDPKKIDEREVARIFGIIENRVKSIDPEELDNTSRQMKEIMSEWKNHLPQKYHDFRAGSKVPLMYPAGTMPNIEWDGRGMETPTSMRSVDASCEVYVLKNSYTAEED
jgi:hypothetical protein